MPQVFNALTGTEMVEVIKEMIGKKLEATGEFKPHNTYPWSRVSFAVGIVAYPQQGMEDTDPKIKVTGKEILVEEGNQKVIEPAGKETRISVSGTEILDTPDKVRVESKLPVPTIVPGPGGQLIDKPVVRNPLPMKKEGK